MQELQQQFTAFRNSGAYQLLTYTDMDAGEEIIQVRIDYEPPPMLGIIVGEVVHNLRSALDHLACVVPLISGAKRPPKPQFPVFDLRDPDPANRRRSAFTRDYKARIGNVTPRVYNIIESVQPYHPANSGWHPLGLLEALWNWDKHNAIHVIAANFGATNVPEGIPEDTIAPNGPIHDCQVLAHAPLGGFTIVNDNPEPLPNINFSIEPAFGDRGPAKGLALFTTLYTIYQYVDREVLGPLERVIYETG